MSDTYMIKQCATMIKLDPYILGSRAGQIHCNNHNFSQANLFNPKSIALQSYSLQSQYLYPPDAIL